MENPKNQLANKLKEASNVLVTVSTNPTIDQLSAAIGLTLFLTKQKKHATTVFSGKVPSIIDFLKPEETIETNTDSLRDFIISLDKAKADKIRYKVEDTMVKIFITPYRTSITDDDLVFSQGDFNVDVVIGLGIQKREDIDQAIMAHGRILHDATVATVNNTESTDLGTLNWTDAQASSLCEMSVALTDLLKPNSLDGQMATAFLTGIVAETDRFSNEKTSSNTMNASAKLMTAGANQQLVATKLQPLKESPEENSDPDEPQTEEPKEAILEDDGSLRINHPSSIEEADKPSSASPINDSMPTPWTPEPQAGLEGQADDSAASEQNDSNAPAETSSRSYLEEPDNSVDNKDIFGLPGADTDNDQPAGPSGDSSFVSEPPQFGGQLSAAADDSYNQTSPLDLPQTNTPLLSRGSNKPKQENESNKPDGPPEPYTVFEPQPDDQESNDEVKDRDNSDPPDPVNFPKAAEPPVSSLPAPSPIASPAEASEPPKPAPEADRDPKKEEALQPYLKYGKKTLADIEEKVDSHHLKPKSKLPEPFVRSLDNTTLSKLEQKVSERRNSDESQPEPEGDKADIDYRKEATSHVVRALSDTTLEEIEDKLDVKKPQPEPEPSVADPAADKQENDKKAGLDYEAHESEPEEKLADKQEPSKESAQEKILPKPEAKTEQKPADAKDQITKEAEDKKPAETSSKPDAKKPEATSGSKPQPDQSADKKPEPTDNGKTAEARQKNAKDAVMQALGALDDKKPAGQPEEPPKSMSSAKPEPPKQEAPDPAPPKQASTPPPVPPPISAPRQHEGPSPRIEIDEQGNLIPLPPDNKEDSADTPPPVPPPMMPPAQKS